MMSIEDNSRGLDRYPREGKGVDILNCRNGLSTDGDVGERRVVERLVSKPVHRKDRSVSSKPVAAETLPHVKSSLFFRAAENIN